MMLYVLRSAPALVATAVFAAGTIATPSPSMAAATAVYGASASVATVAISAAGTSAGGKPVAESKGMGAPAFFQKQMMLGGQVTVALPAVPGATPLEVVIKTPLAKSHVGGHRVADAGGVEAIGQSSTRTLTVALQSANPLVPLNLLTIKAAKLEAFASSQTSTVGVQTNTTRAKADMLQISGALLGGQTVNLGGVLKPGVVYAGPLVTITVGNVSPTTTGGVEGKSVNVVDVSFANSLIAGTPITGHIILNSAAAY